MMLSLPIYSNISISTKKVPLYPLTLHRTKRHAGKPIKYVHGLVEKSGLGDSSVDALLFQYVIHECPQRATRDFIAEAARVVKPGGTLTFVDNNPM